MGAGYAGAWSSESRRKGFEVGGVVRAVPLCKVNDGGRVDDIHVGTLTANDKLSCVVAGATVLTVDGRKNANAKQQFDGDRWTSLRQPAKRDTREDA